MDLIEIILASMCIATLITVSFTVSIILAFRRPLRRATKYEPAFRKFCTADEKFRNYTKAPITKNSK